MTINDTDQTERATRRINDGIWQAADLIDEQTARLIAHALATKEDSPLARFALTGVAAPAAQRELDALNPTGVRQTWQHELVRYLRHFTPDASSDASHAPMSGSDARS